MVYQACIHHCLPTQTPLSFRYAGLAIGPRAASTSQPPLGQGRPLAQAGSIRFSLQRVLKHRYKKRCQLAGEQRCNVLYDHGPSFHRVKPDTGKVTSEPRNSLQTEGRTRNSAAIQKAGSLIFSRMWCDAISIPRGPREYLLNKEVKPPSIYVKQVPCVPGVKEYMSQTQSGKESNSR